MRACLAQGETLRAAVVPESSTRSPTRTAREYPTSVSQGPPEWKRWTRS